MPDFQFSPVDPCSNCSTDSHAVLHMHCPACGKPLNTAWHKGEHDDVIKCHCIACGYPFPIVNPFRLQHLQQLEGLEQLFHSSPALVENLLTPRQTQVAQAYAQHCSAQAVADELSISLETVRSHIKEILQRTYQPSMVQALLVLIANGTITNPFTSDNLSA